MLGLIIKIISETSSQRPPFFLLNGSTTWNWAVPLQLNARNLTIQYRYNIC